MNNNKIQNLEFMLKLYCKKFHNTHILCKECNEIINYAIIKLEKCPFRGTIHTCKTCHIHCFTDNYRKKITEIMRFAGPQMIRHKPFSAIFHLIALKYSKLTKPK